MGGLWEQENEDLLTKDTDMKTKSDAWTDGREKGYQAGVENERLLVCNYLERESKSYENLGCHDEARTLLAMAKNIRDLLHLTSVFKKTPKEKYYAIIGACTKEVIGYCVGESGKKDVLAEEPPATTFKQITKKEYLRRVKD